MAFDMYTKNGHNFYDMSSMLQKAIRRGDYQRAGYAANELSERYRNYLWKRLLIISAEDCYGIITKEIIGLKLADDEVRKSKKGENGNIFVSKAITLLCMALKNRDACYFACNFFKSDELINPDEIEHVDIESCTFDGDIPDWVFDVHTLVGKKRGKTLLDMVRDEQEALNPWQPSLFDNGSWEGLFEQERKAHKMTQQQWADYEQFAQGKELVPQEAK